MYYTTKELNDFANSFNQKSGKYMWRWILKVWNNDEENIKLDQAECIDMDLLSGDFRFNMEAIAVFNKGVKRLFEMLTEVQGSLDRKGLVHPLRQCTCSNCSSPNPAGPGLNEHVIKWNSLNAADNGG